MTNQTYRLPYGKSSIEFVPPSGMQATLAVSRPTNPLKDINRSIAKALVRPIGSAPLRDLAKPGDRACIVFTDITRACPDDLLVPPLLEELAQAGVPDKNITLLCATGMHRPSTHAEKVAKLGAGVVSRFRVIDNEPQNQAVLIDMGFTSGGVPVQLHRAVLESDLIITTGIVEPHQYAGYSGGSKTLAVGAAGEALIAHTHGPAFVDHPCTRLGRIDGNPFQEAIIDVGRRVGLAFIINVVLDDDKNILCISAGDPEAAFLELVNFARSVYEVLIPQQYDIVIGGTGYPKDSNLYQASRAPTYLFFAPIPVVRPGGVLIIPARCEEGAGQGVGEQRFLAAMRDAPDVQTILDDARRNGYPPGQQRAFVLAKVLEKNPVIIVGSEHPQIVSDCKMIPATTMEEAIDLAAQIVGPSCNTLIVPHALLTLPIVQNTSI